MSPTTIIETQVSYYAEAILSTVNPITTNHYHKSGNLRTRFLKWSPSMLAHYPKKGCNAVLSKASF